MVQNVTQGFNGSQQQQRIISRLPLNNFYDVPMRIRSNADLSHRFPEFFKLVDSIKSSVPRSSSSSGSTSVSSTTTTTTTTHDSNQK
ncbi:unnamed protein product [Ambrosiozyma monospora]|uniref:Unnamed protein product n=1 Tax=Ambrosiozyma monospora TaxID=43982 RepID=A0A9W6Z4C6_AMBMO|nr:unnamed protein product [Ambrosiozyma monospora]